MVVSIENTDLLYVPVPKVATTSLKLFLYEVNSGEPFPTETWRDKNKNIHNHAAGYPAREIHRLDPELLASKRCLTVVRDPIDRIKSVYKNRVTYHKALSAERVDAGLAKELGVALDPDFKTFARNLEKYRVLSREIKHHTDPHTVFLGHDLGLFEKVFKFEEVGEFVRYVNEAAGCDVQVGHHQKSYQQPSEPDLDKETLEPLIEFCGGDYALLNAFYAPPAKVNASRRAGRLRSSTHSRETPVARGTDKRPLIIWTLRRSGGTTMANDLFHRSSFASLEHEPFNAGRELSDIRERWKCDKDFGRLKADIRSELESNVNIKFCADSAPSVISQALLEVSCDLGYNHLFLRRNSEQNRLLSLHFAETFGLWHTTADDTSEIEANMREIDLPTGKLIKAEIANRRHLDRIFYGLTIRGVVPAVAIFENLYNRYDRKVASALYDRICDHVQVGANADPEATAQVLFRKPGGKGVGYQSFRNYEAFVSKVQKMPSFELGGKIAPLDASSIHKPKGALLELFRPVRSWRSDLVRIEGVGLDLSDAEVEWSLECDDMELETFTGLKSGHFQKRYPNITGTDRCRFAAIDVPEDAVGRVSLRLKKSTAVP